ncbi:hypothetical protein N8000_07365 [Rhodospirillales bacterium]|nr:hypothetical protein [Rhodospirillales bacterium]
MATKCETQFYETLRNFNHSGKAPQWTDVTDMIGKWQKALDSVGVSRWDQVNIADVMNVDSALTSNTKRVDQLRTGLDAILEKHINLETKVQHRKFIANYRNESAVNSVLADMEAVAIQRKGDEEIAAVDLVKALRDLLSRPADNTKIGLTLEESQNAVFADHFNRLVVSKIYDEIPETHITKLFNDKQFVDDLLAEMHRPQTDVNAKQYKTGNKQAQRVAEILNDAIGQMNLRLTQLGRPTPFDTGNLLPNFNWQKIQAWVKAAGDNGEQRFVEFFADKLDGTNPLDVRVQIAEQVWGNLKKTKGFIDWESVVENVSANGKNTKLKQRVRFKDGESWTAINDAFGEREFMATLVGQFKYLSKQISIAQMFGPDWMRNWQQIQKRIRESQAGNERVFQTKEWRRAQNTFDRLTASPKTPAEVGHGRTLLSAGRSLEVGTKLGSAVITAFMDLPIIINVVTRMYGNSFMRNIDEVMAGFTSKEQRKYAERLNIGVDGMMGALQDRFMMYDDWHSMNTAQRKITNVSNFIMKISGLEMWTDMLRAGVTALFRKEIGALISNQVQWADLDIRFKGTLERFKITEDVWNTLNSRTLDDRGKFDVITIQDRATREAFLAWFKDAAETAVISPSLRDIEHTAWMTQQGSPAEAALQTLMQFKQFPLSYTRKVLGRTVADTSQTRNQKIMTIAQLTAMGTLMGAVVTQTQQIVSGKQPYALDSVDLWTRSFALASPLGILTDMFMDNGGESLSRLLVGEKPTFKDQAKTLLGPLFGDIFTASKYLLEIGGVGGNAALREFGIVQPTYDTERELMKRISKLGQWAIRQVPGQNLWQTKAIYQLMFADALQEMMDPQAYARQQRRILDEGQKRLGEEYFNPYGQFVVEQKNELMQ